MEAFEKLLLQNYWKSVRWTNILKAPDFSEASCWLTGRSIFRLVNVDAGDVIEAVVEFLDNEKMGGASVESEDVRPKAGWIVCEMNEHIESFHALGALQRVVGEIGEVALNGAFVGLYHIGLI